ncbi:MAG: hypothetical protein ACI9RP_002520 [Cyclobacteriaceae bacterium]|jgi:hypothetical protein
MIQTHTMKLLRYTHQYHFYTFLFMVFSCLACNPRYDASMITKSEIRETQDGYRIFLNGEPFYVKGAGIGMNIDPDLLVVHGANAVRTWSTNRAEEILDLAQERGIKVMMGLWIGLERHGFDYSDSIAVKKQLALVRKRVEKYKDHPALMSWGIGNELNLQASNPDVWDAVNDISRMIHEIDTNHLTTTPLAGISKEFVDLIATRAPDLDFLSVQLYAPIDRLPELIQLSTYTGPLLITEWGATGYWEVPKTSWDAPIENNSSVKADLYQSRYENSIRSQSQQVMGSFVFLWGQKQERTPTWFGILMPDGNETESVDVMHYNWNGEWPANRTPRLQDFTLDGQRAIDDVKLTAGQTYTAQVDIMDHENDPLTYRWEVMEESTANQSGGDAEVIPPVIEGLFLTDADRLATFKAPAEPGAYRLFIYVEDGHTHTAHANIPFWVDR